MPRKHKSPAKKARSIKRAMEYKKENLIDLFDLELSLNFKTQEIIWNVTDNIALTLKPNCEVLETRYIFNPDYFTFSLGKRVTSFQSMWKPDQNSFLLFTCLLNHLKQNTILCDKLCGHLSLSPICGDLIQTLASSGGRPPDWSQSWCLWTPASTHKWLGKHQLLHFIL